MTSSWERLGHRHEVAPADGRDLHGSHIGLYVSRSSSQHPARLLADSPSGSVGSVYQQELSQIVTASSTPPLVNTSTVSRISVILRQILQIVDWDTPNMSAITI